MEQARDTHGIWARLPPVAQEDKKSLFVFRFRLSPTYACRRFYWDMAFAGAKVACSRDILSVVMDAHRTDVNQLILTAKRIGAAILDAHAYMGYPQYPALELVSEGWVEVLGAEGSEIMVGYSDPSTSMDPLSFEADENVPFWEIRRGFYERAVSMVDGLGAALADFRAARQATAGYVGIYAYRVLEDIATSVSGVTDPEKRKQAWEASYRVLGASRAEFQLVEDVSKKSRHGNPLAGETVTDAEAAEVLRLAKVGLDRWIQSAARGPA
jgi:hypothetical protein